MTSETIRYMNTSSGLSKEKTLKQLFLQRDFIKIHFLKHRKLINNSIFTISIATYILSMVAVPLWVTGFDWINLQNVWDRWQTLNSAVIALTASIIAYKASIYHYQSDRENNFRAAKSKLPHALSDVRSYAKACANIHQSFYYIAGNNIGVNKYKDFFEIPQTPQEAVDTFVECIRYSDLDVGTYLAKILEEMQIIKYRIESLKDKRVTYAVTVDSCKSNMKLITLSCLKITHLFSFARNEEIFNPPEITIEGLRITAEYQLELLGVDLFPVKK